MNTKILNNLGIVMAIVALIVAGVGLKAPVIELSNPLGGSTSASWSAASFQVSGTEVISSSRAITPVTLTVTGESNLSKTIQGGSVATLGTASSTLTAANVCDNSGWTQTPGVSGGETGDYLITNTLPATSTLYADCLTANGKYFELVYINATSSYGASTTFAKGAGIELMKSSDTGGTVTILPQEKAVLKFYRYSIATTTVAVDIFENGD